MFWINATRNLYELGREILAATVVHLISPAIDQATSSPLASHR